MGSIIHNFIHFQSVCEDSASNSSSLRSQESSYRSCTPFAQTAQGLAKVSQTFSPARGFLIRVIVNSHSYQKPFESSHRQLQTQQNRTDVRFCCICVEDSILFIHWNAAQDQYPFRIFFVPQNISERLVKESPRLFYLT